MQQDNLIQLSENIINEYCKKDLSLFFQYADDNITWIGPRQSQIAHSKAAMLAGWINPEHQIDFSISNVEATVIPAGPKNREVLLCYDVHGKLTNGKTFIQPQRAQFSWMLKQKEYRLLVLHFSNPADLDARDLIYNTWGDIERADYLTRTPQFKETATAYIMLRGHDKAYYRFLSSSIMWIESTDEGHHCKVHTREQLISCMDRLSFFEEQYPDIFLRPHVSYLVNPHYIKSLRRFELALWDGTVLPVPEKKYTALKNALLVRP